MTWTKSQSAGDSPMYCQRTDQVDVCMHEPGHTGGCWSADGEPADSTTNPEWWERAVSGTCSHGGHGWDGDTCSDAAAGHVTAPDELGGGPYDTCGKCGKAIQTDVYGSGRLVTMVGRNAECYGR